MTVCYIFGIPILLNDQGRKGHQVQQLVAILINSQRGSSRCYMGSAPGSMKLTSKQDAILRALKSNVVTEAFLPWVLRVTLRTMSNP